jgi:hypothetical protein
VNPVRAVIFAILVVAGLAVAASARLHVTGNPTVAALTPTPTPTNTPGGPGLPDLRPGAVTIDFENYGACNWVGTPLGLHVTARNVGPTGAGSFVVNANGHTQTVGGLAAGSNILLFFPGGQAENFNPQFVYIDSTDIVPESDESNNVFNAPVALPTAPATCTATPGPSATPTPTATPDLCANGPDCDGFQDAPPLTLHIGPANVNTSYDNCPGAYNPGQTNSDGNYIGLTPLLPANDVTHPASDALGDARDTDDDNDGLSDVSELTGGACGGVVTSSVERDTDLDRVLDGAECTLGTDPSSASSSPNAATCALVVGGMATNVDADGVLDHREYCYYGTARVAADDDGDGCGDAQEIASINSDRSVNVLDLLIVAQAAGAYGVPGNAVQRNADITKNGTVDVIDLGLVASAASTTCP